MQVIEVAHNFNADLIKALLESDILHNYEYIFKNNITVVRYDGKDTYLFEIDYYDGDAEYFVPKTVPKEIADNMILFLELKVVCQVEKEQCEDAYYNCVQAASEAQDIFPNEEIDKWMSECVEERDRCLDELDECHVANESVRNLYKYDVRFFGCVSGKEKGSPDIDEICTFVLRSIRT